MHKKQLLTGITIVMFLMWLLLAGPALAVDGVIEISQERTTAGGITSGDSPGFPVRLSKSGSYMLTSNLNVPTDTDGITIETSNVTIDLNGFTIAGNGGGSGNGITSVGGTQKGVTIRNGVVHGMGDNGIEGFSHSLIEAIHVYDNGDSRGDYGIDVNKGCIIRGNTVYGNSNDGIHAKESCTISGNTVYGNGDKGIYVNKGCTVSGNTVMDNGGDGIEANHGCTVIGNTLQDNEDNGIQSNYGNTIISNTVYGNTNLGLRMGNYCGYKENVVSQNNGGNRNKQVLGGIEIGNNVCGRNTDCSP